MLYSLISTKQVLFACSLLFASTFSIAQTIQTTNSTLDAVTVYSQGANMQHTTPTIQLPKGNSELVIHQIARQINPESIRVLNSNKNIQIHSVSFERDYLTLEENKSNSYNTLKKEYDKEKGILATKTNNRKSEEGALSMLEANKQIGGSNGVTQANLTQMLQFYRNEYKQITENLIRLKKEEEEQKKIVDKLAKQLAESGGENTNAGQLVLHLHSDTPTSASFEIDYYTYLVSWTPSYEIRVDDIESPMNLVYNANLSQQTGIDWEQVSLNFSSANPIRNNNPPVLDTWWLSYRPTHSDMAMLRAQSASALKYSEQALTVTEEETYYDSSMANIANSQLQTSFVVNSPYDVVTNKKPIAIPLQNYPLPAEYTYYSVPDKHDAAFLLAKVSDWEQYHLLPGQAQLNVDQQYAGNSYINPNTTTDTLEISLGIDERIITKRKRIEEKGSKPTFLGNTQKRKYSYEIELRNTRKEAATIEVKELFPVSTEKDIEIKLDQVSGAQINSEKGELTWKVELKPNESKKLLVSYTIHYPKGKELSGL